MAFLCLFHADASTLNTRRRFEIIRFCLQSSTIDGDCVPDCRELRVLCGEYGQPSVPHGCSVDTLPDSLPPQRARLEGRAPAAPARPFRVVLFPWRVCFLNGF